MGVYAISDLHGNYELWTKVKEWLKPSDKLFCLGDNIDRGNDGIKIVQDIRNRENTTVLLGNHENMLIDYLPGSIKYNEIFALWYRNGGQPTFDAIKKNVERRAIRFIRVFPATVLKELSLLMIINKQLSYVMRALLQVKKKLLSFFFVEAKQENIYCGIETIFQIFLHQ